MGRIVIRPHVLSDRGELCYDAPSGTTLQEIADSTWPIEAHECVVLTVDGDVIPWEYWHVVTPKDGTVVHGVLTFGKGGGGKNILASVAMIAVAIAAPYAGAALFGAGTFAASAAAVGFTMVGAMAVNAMFKPTLAGPGTSRYTDPKESNTYQITGQSNQASPYGPCIRVYGQHRVFPKLAAVPFTVTEGSEQYLYMLLDWGFGPLDLDHLRIGETPLSQYKEVQYRIDENFVKGSNLVLYPSDVAVEQIGVELDTGVWQQRTTELSSIGIGVDLVFPRGLTYFSDQGNKQQTSVQLSLELAVAGSGNWFPYTYYGARTSAPSVVSIAGPQWFMSRGIKIPGGGPPVYGLPAGATSGYVSTGAGAPVNGNQIMWPNGTVSTITSVASAGQNLWLIGFAALPYSVAYGTDGWSYLQVTVIGNSSNTLTVKAASSEPLTVSINISVPVGQYDMRIRRDTAASTNARLFNEVTFAALRSNANRPPLAPTRAHCIMELKIRASAQLSNVVQQLNGIATARLPTWNGSSWVTQATDNPASAFLDVLKGSANRVPVPDERIDYASIQAWSEWCDRPAQDGLPYYRFSHVLDYSTTMYKLLNSIAGAGRATLANRDGKIGVIMDQSQTVPAQMFTPRNSWGFETVRSYNPSPHALRVGFNDANQGYELRQFYVYADGYNVNNATVFEDIQTFGVTRHGQAWREGRYVLAQGLLRREQFTIQVDVENLACIRGDLVLVQHDVLKVGGDSSRISEVVSGTVIRQYDAIPTLAPGYTYGVRIRKATGVLTAPVSATNTGPYEWTLSASVSGIAKDDLLTWGIYGTETGEYIVKDILPGDDLTATVTMMEYASAIYSSDTGTIPAYKPPQNGRPDGIVAQPPTNVRLRNRHYTLGRRPAVDLIIAWNPPRVGNYEKYIVNTRSPTGSVINITTTDKNESAIFTGVDVLTSAFTDHTQYYGVAAVDYVGSTSDTMWVEEYLQNPMWLPDPVLHFSSNVVGESTTLTWRDPEFNLHEGNNQIVGYDIRWSHASTATFEQATRISELVAWPSSMVSVPTRNGVYMIKPFTSSGVYAGTAARTMVMTEDLVKKDYYSQPRFNPAWAGTFINCEIATDELRMTPDAEGNYPGVAYWIATAPQTFLQVLTLRVQAFIAAYGFTASETLDSAKFTPLENAVPLGSAGGAQKYDAKLWISATDPLGTGSLDLSNARPIIQGAIETDTVYFIVELRSFDAAVSPSVVVGGADLDFPEREEFYPDYAVGTAVSRVVFNFPFVAPPTVAITLQNANAGEYVWRGNIDQYGFDVQVRNSSGVGVAGVLDIGVWGPGRISPAPFTTINLLEDVTDA